MNCRWRKDVGGASWTKGLGRGSWSFWAIRIDLEVIVRDFSAAKVCDCRVGKPDATENGKLKDVLSQDDGPSLRDESVLSDPMLA